MYLIYYSFSEYIINLISPHPIPIPVLWCWAMNCRNSASLAPIASPLLDCSCKLATRGSNVRAARRETSGASDMRAKRGKGVRGGEIDRTPDKPPIFRAF